MTLIEKIETLENKINELENMKYEEYVTPKQLADRMQCSPNFIYIKIREGEIKTVKNLGTCIRIPISQFAPNAKTNSKVININRQKKRDMNKPSSIEDIKQLVWQ